ncbi:zinc c6 finger domain protein [Ophiostoma piceae UAMH 11346]|uniref:Zinc c6 finger domain protein n=1 Tax=Ophiostoma piceae (strain UAMH 11346) TaxID=1262450 RepID=S3CAL5_OPHP1|nr:zinc c6 finger domain protein [Ophiostoma piceae UAMH 11346]
MIGKRSRQGCEECRKRRRKCDEAKPICGPCSSYHRTCNYTLKLIWGGRPMGAAAGMQGRSGTGAGAGVGGSGSGSGNSSIVGTARRRGGSLMRPIPQQVGRLERLERLQRADADGNTGAIETGQATAAGHDEHDQQDEGRSAAVTTVAFTTAATVTVAATSTSTALVLPPTLNVAPPCLPNGVPLSPPYQRLLDYFTKDILASLSVHPSIHQDLCQGLVPTMLHSPHLLSAGLALSAAGLVSRGLSNVAGVDITRVIEHLQLSGLALLRQALQRGMRNNVVMATCLLWCLADVFAAGSDPDAAASETPSATSLSILESVTAPHSSTSSSSSASSYSSSSSTGPAPSSASAASSSSWRIHLQGIKALLGGDQAFETFVTSAGSSRSAMRHLYLLYLSLQTLPYVPPADNRQRLLPSSARPSPAILRPPSSQQLFPLDDFMPVIGGDDAAGDAPPRIDGFLGYSEELLDILQEIDHIANMPPDTTTDVAEIKPPHEAGNAQIPAPPLSGAALAAANVLLGKAQGLILRDAATALPVMIAEPELSAASRREFVLCHRSFQQATLIHLYRRLFRLPSYSAPIQEAVTQIHLMAGQMTQGAPCSTWVAMSMPLFTVGCEACTPAQQAWSHASLDTLAASIGSMHVRVVRQALEDVWRLRARRGDTDGRLCAGQLLDELNYNIILF